MARSATTVVPGLLILVAAVFLCGLLGKSIKKVAVIEDEREAAAAVALEKPDSVSDKIVTMLKDVRYTGSVSGSGWSGAAAYKCPAGHSLKVGVKGAKQVVECVDTTLSVAAKGALPSLELSASGAPGADPASVKYGAKLAKEVKSCPACPQIYAALTNAGVSLGTSLLHKITDDLDLNVKLDVPYNYGSSEVDPTLGADASYKVAGGKVVGSFLAKKSGGLKGSKVSATYDLR